MKRDPIVERLQPDAASAADCIRVFIRDCRVGLRIGVYDREMSSPQPVIVNVEMEAALPHRYRDREERKLDRVINYEDAYAFITRELPGMGHVYLLETVAEQIIDFCFRDPRVRRIRVRIEKTGIFEAAAGAGIEIVRERREDSPR